jgi:hypothetical protein
LADRQQEVFYGWAGFAFIAFLAVAGLVEIISSG